MNKKSIASEDSKLSAKGLIALAYSHAMALHDSRTVEDKKIQLGFLNQTVNEFIDSVELNIKNNVEKLTLFKEAHAMCMKILWTEQNLYRGNKLLIKVAHGYTVILERRMKETKKTKKEVVK